MKHECTKLGFLSHHHHIILVNITIIIANSPSDRMKGGGIAVLQIAVQGHVALLHLVHRHHRLHPHTHLWTSSGQIGFARSR